jgi:hypothetical protein
MNASGQIALLGSIHGMMIPIGDKLDAEMERNVARGTVWHSGQGVLMERGRLQYQGPAMKGDKWFVGFPKGRNVGARTSVPQSGAVAAIVIVNTVVTITTITIDQLDASTRISKRIFKMIMPIITTLTTMSTIMITMITNFQSLSILPNAPKRRSLK